MLWCAGLGMEERVRLDAKEGGSDMEDFKEVSSGYRGRPEVLEPVERPLLSLAPRSATFFPLAVLAAVLPGLYALRSWDLDSPGPWWGLRGLAVLDGWRWDQVPAGLGLGSSAEEAAFRAIALQPPLSAWLEGATLSLSTTRAPLATILPSFVGGALTVILVYLLGRQWAGPGVGLIAAILTAFNPTLLSQMQSASPTTWGLAATLSVLYAGYRHWDADQKGFWRRGVFVLGGGAALGGSLLAIRGLGWLVVPILAAQRLFIGSDPLRTGSRAGRSRSVWRSRGLLALEGLTAIGIALAIAGPWYVSMWNAYGREFLSALFRGPDYTTGGEVNLAALLVSQAPGCLALGTYGAWRAFRAALIDETNDPDATGGAFLVIWLMVAGLATSLWTAGPRPALELFPLIPLCLLSARAMVDLARRTVSARALAWLAPATAWTIAWWCSSHIRDAARDLANGRRPDAASALGLHLGLDLIFAILLLTRALEHWTRRRDDRRRLLIGGFLFTALAATVVIGSRELEFRRKETTDLLALRDIIMRRQRENGFQEVAIIDSDRGPTTRMELMLDGRLRFLLRSALPGLTPRELTDAEQLATLPGRQRLVILTGSEPRLAYPAQSRWNLEEIHPGCPGIAGAFATIREEPPPMIGLRPNSARETRP